MSDRGMLLVIAVAGLTALSTTGQWGPCLVTATCTWIALCFASHIR